MKLGDNMTMEACNVWSDVTPRKYRPPRIGDIPKRSAIDRPSPSDSLPYISRQTKILPSESVLSDVPSSSKVLSSPEYIQEVRKDSALYLEEVEETLKSTLKPTYTDVRRQSSGYVSPRGSFDDNRSSTTNGDTQPQDLLPKERRVSRTKALIKNLAYRVEESIEEQELTADTSEKKMPTTEIHRKVSSSGLDMPSIEEMKEVLKEKTLPRQENPESNELTENVVKLQLTSSCKDLSHESGGSMREMDEAARVQQVIDTTGLSDSKSAPNTNVATAIAADSSRIIDTKKLSLSGEAGSKQRLPRETVNVTDKPIPPRYPYSTPQGSPRMRNRVLNREHSVGANTCNFIDNQHDSQQLNQYKVLDEIGKGSFGVVKKVYNEEDGVHYAMKIVSKRKLMKKTGIFGKIPPRRAGADPLAKVYKEIAILKKLDHPNVVKLVEVLDHPDKDNLYLVFELVHRGEILVIPTENPLTEEIARRYFRDVVMGVEYLHYQKIVHRDIKPSNLLVDRDDRIKIADLGVSTELREPGELLSGKAGTPAFAAPETSIANAQYSGPPCDVWSMGVTLYALVAGHLPWNESDGRAIHEIVRNEPLVFPSHRMSLDMRDLIERMLDKVPESRITISEMKQHSWLTNNSTEPLPSEADNCRVPVTVTEEEVIRLGTLLMVKNMLKQHSFQNPFLPKRLGRTANNDTQSPASGQESAVSSSLRHDATRDAKTERFHESGRSNSAPDSYDWHTSGRQMSMENPLSPVTEAERRQ
ncbi:calcium/calmodulin-dependent protein kinase kinase 1 [Cataglyphis hispanica]|uniref:calcium/calmodulin-dependent protein kinase kinase 1 n=1 Tax=Cataglyphis hispanica TaxID=1086592 RepID=UPI00217FC9A3|nr:calcium/calmodulin-dependent protein kinase kinase 1 [Cataglyphis hispanica]